MAEIAVSAMTAFDDYESDLCEKVDALELAITEGEAKEPARLRFATFLVEKYGFPNLQVINDLEDLFRTRTGYTIDEFVNLIQTVY